MSRLPPERLTLGILRFAMPMSDFANSPEFQKLLAHQGEVDLVQLMLELAADAYPQLDRVGCLLEIDRLAVACCDEVARCSCKPMRERLQAISRTLYEVEGFHGNRESYDEPQNSYLNEVLARRRGIPISLGILYQAIAARAGLRMFGCNTPGHFVIGCCTGTGDRYFVDPFTNGDVLDCQQCKCRIRQTVGMTVHVSDEHFRPASCLEIVVRVLRNLKVAHSMQNHWCQVLQVQQRLTALLPQMADERRDLGLVYLRLGQPTKALPLLEHCQQACGGQYASALEPSIQAARRMIAELN